MIRNKVLYLLVYGLGWFVVSGGTLAYAADLPEDPDQAEHALLAPVVERAQALNIPVQEEAHAALKNVAHQLSVNLPDPSVQHLMTLGSQYLQNMRISCGPNEDDYRLPSLLETARLLENLGAIESHHPQQPIEVTHFIYRLLEDYFYAAPVVHHLYYLALFHRVLREAEMDQPRTESIVYWAQGFLRASHTENDCTAIMLRIAAYMRDHPHETYEEGPLQDAIDDHPAWADHEVRGQLNRYLTDVYASSSSSDDEGAGEEGDDMESDDEMGTQLRSLTLGR